MNSNPSLHSSPHSHMNHSQYTAHWFFLVSLAKFIHKVTVQIAALRHWETMDTRVISPEDILFGEGRLHQSLLYLERGRRENRWATTASGGGRTGEQATATVSRTKQLLQRPKNDWKSGQIHFKFVTRNFFFLPMTRMLTIKQIKSLTFTNSYRSYRKALDYLTVYSANQHTIHSLSRPGPRSALCSRTAPAAC